MDFTAAQAYLVATINESVSRRSPYRLERMRGFLRELGDPQNAYPTLHVGGTSGKGSTATMLAAMLQAGGNRTGLHTKPHLRSMTERARIDGADIEETRFAELLAEMLPAIDRTAERFERPSYYETLLALAFLYFAHEHVDVAVIEVGLGGTLDGTNVIVPQVSIITTVGLDHTDVLGNTLEEIAADKAGIAKPGVPLVSAVSDPGARRVIEERCAAVGAPFISVLDTSRIHPHASVGFVQHCTIETPVATYDVHLPSLGGFQRDNAATAIRAAEQLSGSLRPSQAAIEGGLSTVRLAGRMEFFPGHPGVVFDIAHNPEKAARLAEALGEQFPGRRFHFVVAIGESKDAHEVLRVLHDLGGSFILTTFSAAGRSASKPARLASIAESTGAWARTIVDPVEAFAVARRGAPAGDIVVVTGSTFVVAELRQWWFEHVVSETALR
jgi:dihydrofolate synthase/folylpolyglutamate synthase